MGAKSWMLAYADGNAAEILKSNPQLDRPATTAFAKRLFPHEKLEVIGDTDLYYTCPPEDELVAACFPGLSLIAAVEIARDYPSQLPAHFLEEAANRTIYLHAMHSVVDWFAFAVWKNGALARSLSLSPDGGILEDIGPRLSFEGPYWSGAHQAVDPEDDEEGFEYPFPFHPLELGEAALAEFFGYQLEGMLDSSLLEPDAISLLHFKRSRPWWKIW